MTTFDPSMTEQFNALLSRREQALRQALGALDDGEAAAGHEVSDFKDMALRNLDAELDEAQASHLQQALAQVHTARQRLHTHQYGQCLACGQAVDLRRLQALPEAELCTPCQQAREQARR